MSLDDQIAQAWIAGSTLSQAAETIGLTRSAVAGRVARARRRGNSRFAPRPGPSREETKRHRLEADRARYHRAHPFAGRRVAAGEAPGLQFNLPLWGLEADMCRMPVNDVPAGRGLDFRFCGRKPTVRGYCTHCRALIYRPVADRVRTECGPERAVMLPDLFDGEELAPISDAASEIVRGPALRR